MLLGFATINYWAEDVAAAKRWYAANGPVRTGGLPMPSFAHWRL